VFTGFFNNVITDWTAGAETDQWIASTEHLGVAQYEISIGNGVIIGASGNPLNNVAMAPGLGNLAFKENHGIYAITSDGDPSHPALIFQDTASAVNYAELTNSATGTPVGFAAAGTDSNIDLTISAKGTGKVNVPFVLNSSYTNSAIHALAGGI
jgi:hypothetical protein